MGFYKETKQHDPFADDQKIPLEDMDFPAAHPVDAPSLPDIWAKIPGTKGQLPSLR